MGFMDKIKGLLEGREKHVKQGIDKVSDVVERKVPTQHRDKVEGAAAKAKDMVDDLTDAPATTGATPSETVTTPSATPPAPSATAPSAPAASPSADTPTTPPSTATPLPGSPPSTEP